MKTFKVLSLIAVTGFLFSFTIFNYSTSPTLEGNIITWKGEKVAGSHEGTISIKSGGLNYDEEGKLIGGEFKIDMNTITCTDLKGEWKDKLVGHLNSGDFFNVAEFPEAAFKITKVEKSDKADYSVTGNLNIKGISHELSFLANVKEDDGVKIANAMINVDRTLYDIKYGSGKFFEGLGDKMIKDFFELNVTLVSE